MTRGQSWCDKGIGEKRVRGSSCDSSRVERVI